MLPGSVAPPSASANARRGPYGANGRRGGGGWIPLLPESSQHHHGAYPSGAAPIPFAHGGGRFRHGEPSMIGMHFFTAALRALQPRVDDDLIDRLNYYYSSTMIVMFAVLVSAKQYVGHPIECWVPAQFTKAMEQYAENYCWIQNTYWVPFSDLIPNRWEERERRQIGYYQWVPFILVLEALLFYIPAMIWRLLNTQSGINTVGILQMASAEHNMEPENRIRTVHILSRHLDDALRYQRDFGTKNKSVYLWAFVRLGKFYGAYVSILYIFVKFLYFSNAIGQFFLLNRFLETADYPFFGAHVLKDLLSGTDWQHSGKFPRVTLCDFDIRVVGNIHRHTVQCVLVINMFTEKIFICLWLWLLFLSFTDLFGLLFWSVATCVPTLRTNFILKHLDLSDSPPDHSKDAKHIRKFVVHYLRPDGVLMLRLIANHGGNILCSELVYSLWLRYRETYKLSVDVCNEDEMMEDMMTDDRASSAATASHPDKRSMMTGLPTVSDRLAEKAASSNELPDEEVEDGDDDDDSPLTDAAALTAAQLEAELEPWAKPPPPMPTFVGNHRPTIGLGGGGGGLFGKGRFIPERPNHSGSPVTVVPDRTVTTSSSPFEKFQAGGGGSGGGGGKLDDKIASAYV